VALSAHEIAEKLAKVPVILLVDDDSSCRTLAKEYLKAYTCSVLESDCGEAAIKIASQQHLDLILLDLKMPGMDGVETMRKLKELLPGVPVAIVSGYLREYDANRILDFGVLTCIRKPMTPLDFAPLFEMLKIRVQPNFDI